MESKKFLWGGVLVAIVIATLGLQFPRVQQTVQQVIGANPGPDSSSECISQNGLNTCRTRKGLTVATTTPCAVRSPVSTSTLVATALQITTATTSDTVTYELATSTTAFATTTRHFGFTLSAGSVASFNYSPTSTERQVMAPNSWVVWGAKGTTPGSSSNLNGSCFAIFNVL